MDFANTVKLLLRSFTTKKEQSFMAFRKAYASLVINIPVVFGRLLRHFVPRKILFHPMLLSDRDFANEVKQSFMTFRKAYYNPFM